MPPNPQFPLIEHGTCVAFYADDNFIAIAADSKINHEDGSANIAQKIQNKDDIYWVSIGLYKFSDVFDIDHIINEVLYKELSIEESQNEISRLTIAGLKLAVEGMRNANFTNFLKPDCPILSTLITSIVNKKAVFKYINYCYVPKENNSFDIESKLVVDQLSLGPNYNIFTVLGSDKTAKHVLQWMLLQENSNFITNNPKLKVDGMPNGEFQNIGDVLYHLVYLECRGNPKEVGLPISVIYLTENGLIPIFNYRVESN